MKQSLSAPLYKYGPFVNKVDLYASCTVDGRHALGPDVVNEGDKVNITHASQDTATLAAHGHRRVLLVGQLYLENSIYGELCSCEEDDAVTQTR